MFSPNIFKKKSKGDAERPFWISYADLMTAMMTLCLVAMAVTILAMNQELKRELSGEEVRAKEIRDVCDSIKNNLKNVSAIHVNCTDNRIDFGEAGRFDYNGYRLKPEAEGYLGMLVPVVLEAASSDVGKKWLKQVVIEGYTDTQGPYLYNLYLSLQRSYWVMCALVDTKRNSNMSLTDNQIQMVRRIFLAGGVSFNDPKNSAAESRRVELRLQFYSRAEKESGDEVSPPKIIASKQDACQL